MDWLYLGWHGPLRALVVGAAIYVILVFLIRLSGKRTLAKMNAFDLVVTIALGSMFASTILSKTTPLADGFVGIATLIGMQWIVAWGCSRSESFEDLVKSKPTLLIWKGELLNDTIRRERLSAAEIRCAIRKDSHVEVEDVDVAVLETTGDISVVSADLSGDRSALKCVSPIPGDE